MPSPLVIAGAAQVGQQIFGALGASKRRKTRQRALDKERQRLEKLRGTNVIDVNAITAAGDRAIIEQSAKSGRRIDKSLGLDVGQAQGGIAERLAGSRAALRTSNIRENQILTARRDENIDRRLFDIELLRDEGGGETLSTIGNVLGIAGQVGAGLAAESQAKKVAGTASQQALAVAPKGVGEQFTRQPSPGEGDFQRTTAIAGPSGIPILGGGDNVFQQQATVEAQTGGGVGGLQPAPKSLQEFVLQKISSGGLSPEEITAVREAALALKGKSPEAEGRDVPEFATPAFKDLSGIQKGFQTELGKFLKGSPEQETATGFRPTTVADFTKQTGKQEPDIKQIFDATMADIINRKLGPGAADSVFAQIASSLGLDPQVIQADEWGKKVYGKDWDNIPDEQKIGLFNKYASTQSTR